MVNDNVVSSPAAPIRNEEEPGWTRHPGAASSLSSPAAPATLLRSSTATVFGFASVNITTGSEMLTATGGATTSGLEVSPATRST